MEAAIKGFPNNVLPVNFKSFLCLYSSFFIKKYSCSIPTAEKISVDLSSPNNFKIRSVCLFKASQEFKRGLLLSREVPSKDFKTVGIQSTISFESSFRNAGYV